MHNQERRLGEFNTQRQDWREEEEEKRQITYLSLSEWRTEQGQSGVVDVQKFLRSNRREKVLESHNLPSPERTQNIKKNDEKTAKQKYTDLSLDNPT